ncbi:kinase-like protein [Peniophora sp. CONT]|nr:kinase-like protein [Peniophora sp. CONT]
MASTSELSPFSRLLPRKTVDPVEGTRGYQNTRKRVGEATTSVAGVAVTVAHDVLSTGVDLLQLAPIPALGTAGTVLLSIWDAVQLIEINREACLRLTERCAEALLSVHEEIRLAGPGAANELGEPLRKLHSAFNEVHVFLLRQKHRTFLQRYLKRDEDQRDISHCNSSLDDTISLFSVKIQIRTLKLVQESEARRQEDSKVLASLVTAPSSLETSSVDTTASVSGMEIDQLNDPVKVRWLLASYRRAQGIRDRNADFIDLRTLLSAALNERNDIAMIEVLQIGRDEMPEAIRTLQRVLQHDAENVRQHVHPTVAAVGPGRLQSDTTPAPDSNSSRGKSALEPFDRDFISTGIEALSRLTLNQGAEIAVPRWTITRHEVEIEKKIGVGFFSDVYKGQCRERTVAIKVLTSTTPRKLFVHEVNIWIQLQHPHVIKLLGASSTTSDPPWFLVSPYYVNGNLVQYLKGLDPGSSPNLLRMMHEVAEGMLYLHDNGILHGDLKASNILVDDHLQCIISDFGQSEIKSEVYRLSALPISCGTLRWQSPELMLGIITRLTPEVDMYAFGVLCAEILNRGALPWPLFDDNAVRNIVCEQDRRPNLPAPYTREHPISVIIQAAWHRENRLRPTFRTIVQQLTTVCTTSAVQTSETVSHIAQLSKKRRRTSSLSRESSPPDTTLTPTTPRLGPGKSDKSAKVDRRTYCICGQDVNYDMVACDVRDCEKRWYHFICVGLTVLPDGKWVCDECLRKQQSERKYKRRNHFKTRSAGRNIEA